MTDIIINDLTGKVNLPTTNNIHHIVFSKTFIEKAEVIIASCPSDSWSLDWNFLIAVKEVKNCNNFQKSYRIANDKGETKHFIINSSGPAVVVFENIKQEYEAQICFQQIDQFGGNNWKSIKRYTTDPQDFLQITETARVEFGVKPYSPDYEYCFLTVENAQLTVNDDFYKSGEILTYHDLKTASLTFSDATKSGDVIMCKRVPQGDTWDVFYNSNWEVQTAWHYDPKK